MGYNDGGGRPRVAGVSIAASDGTGNGTGEGEGVGEGEEGPVWMLRQGMLKHKVYEGDYKPLECTTEGGLSCKLANGTDTVSEWVGCGVQLSWGRDVDIGYGGLNCSSVSLEVVLGS